MVIECYRVQSKIEVPRDVRNSVMTNSGETGLNIRINPNFYLLDRFWQKDYTDNFLNAKVSHTIYINMHQLKMHNEIVWIYSYQNQYD